MSQPGKLAALGEAFDFSKLRAKASAKALRVAKSVASKKAVYLSSNLLQLG